MSAETKADRTASVVVLEAEMGIQQAAAFHQAVVPLAASGGAVCIDAKSVRSVHSSIMQILHALSQALPVFGIANESDEFRAAEARMGLSFARWPAVANPNDPPSRAEVPHV